MKELEKLATMLIRSMGLQLSEANYSGTKFEFSQMISEEKCIIKMLNTNLLVEFKLSLHHLDMPWEFEVLYKGANEVINISDYYKKIKMVDSLYEVYPKLLQNIELLGPELVQELSNDVSIFIMNRAKTKMD